MAKFKIKNINYIVSGKTSRLVSICYARINESFDQNSSDVTKTSKNNINNAVPYKVLADENTKNALGENIAALQIFESPEEIQAWKNAQLYDTNDKVFVAGISQNMNYIPDSMTDDIANFQNCNNVFSLYDKEDNTIIHPLFDVQDLCFKSYIQKYLDLSSDVDLSKQYTDIYAPQISGVLACTSLSGSIFMLTDKVDKYIGMYKALEEINSSTAEEIQDVEYTFQITEDALSTLTYKNISSNGNISSVFDPGNVFIGLDYNCIIEIPASFSEYNDFKNGNAFGNPIYCKNHYNSLYSTCLNDNKNALSSARQYINAFTCGDKVYLKYYDTANYIAIAQSENMITMDASQSRKKCICQCIESIDKYTAYKNNIRHRSNMFSIDINNTDLGITNSTGNLVKLKKCIQQDIKNNIQNIAKKICPAHAQLFTVNIQN